MVLYTQLLSQPALVCSRVFGRIVTKGQCCSNCIWAGEGIRSRTVEATGIMKVQIISFLSLSMLISCLLTCFTELTVNNRHFWILMSAVSITKQNVSIYHEDCWLSKARDCHLWHRPTSNLLLNFKGVLSAASFSKETGLFCKHVFSGPRRKLYLQGIYNCE